MTASQLNLDLFTLINSSNQSFTWLTKFGLFIANDLLYLLIMIFAICWLRGGTLIKTYIFKAFIFTAIALCISLSFSNLFYFPRPFTLGIGHQILAHTANGSFPSDHMLIFSCIAFSYLFSPFKKLGILLLCVALLVGWSRVFVGVHFPVDILGGFTLAFIVNLIGFKLWQQHQERIMRFILKIYSTCCKPLINKGIIK
ncbi:MULTISPECIES: phosphatase PAP2 family protein [unclassified Acinetobacter]|uniref:phosphatase PAP2 family protein n=1 Tax=unclassified Acinetobacter TaxID=196816 RepID=UPI0029342B61|nr:MULTISPECIES: phosphatase PAP2 family protein [unclassified Acinetobacter]WOE32670.1 phosphatase PAP2 family protein [Acinetobacter sp. SAAs470]WOE38146.1 phosphatase PAP2 family protein [Acinetobacter sp. SAAs474]